MLYMNDWDIDMAVGMTIDYPIRNRGARFLKAFKDEVNAHSDGWAYWKQPLLAAKKLMVLVQGRTFDGDATDAQYTQALAPIKSFYTRRGNAAGMTWPGAQS